MSNKEKALRHCHALALAAHDWWLAVAIREKLDRLRSISMPKRHRFIYTRSEGGRPFRGFASKSELEHIVEAASYLGAPIAFIRGATWNFDFTLNRPRIDGRETSLSELWYRAEWEKVDPHSLAVNSTQEQ